MKLLVSTYHEAQKIPSDPDTGKKPSGQDWPGNLLSTTNLHPWLAPKIQVPTSRMVWQAVGGCMSRMISVAAIAITASVKVSILALERFNLKRTKSLCCYERSRIYGKVESGEGLACK